jgi:periplasmic divalent cation tolerance protein
MSNYYIVLCNCTTLEEAKNIAHNLVSEKLCACVNLIPNHLSIYMWEGDLIEEQEIQLIIKTTKSLYKPLEKRIVELHNYEVPEIIAINIEEAHPKYLQWIEDNITS